jgi:hypothetical protein
MGAALDSALNSTESRARATRWLGWAVAGILFLHLFSSAFPVTAVEGDELGVVNGVEALERGTSDFTEAGYLYPIQSGTYVLLRVVVRLTGLPVLASFGLVTVVGATAFIALGALLLSRLLQLPVAWMIVALLTAQECSAAASYANTSALANALALGGVLLAGRAGRPRTLCVAGVLLALGGWLRGDALLISPAVLPMRAWAGSWTRAWRETTLVAGVALTASAVLLLLSGVPLSAPWATYAAGDPQSTPGQVIVWCGRAFGHVATFMAVAGLIGLCGRRQWTLLAIVVGGAFLPVAIYASFTSPKYFHSAIPFFALAAIWLGRELWMRYREGAALAGAAAAFGLLLHLGEGAIGLQTSSPALRRYEPAPLHPGAALFRRKGREVLAGLGEGEILPTADGPRLQTGWFWAPTMWRREKSGMREETARLDRLLGLDPPATLVASNYLSYRLIDGWLRAHGFRQVSSHILPAGPPSFDSQWVGARGRLEFTVISDSPREREAFATATEVTGRVLFLNDRGFHAFEHLAGDRARAGAWTLLSPTANGLVAWYSRG